MSALSAMCYYYLMNALFAFFKKHWIAICLLLLLFGLRIPNFFEPYWYGDEAIYLTIGNGLRQGERLYAEIIDHKTPLIYYFALVPHQFWFRVLNLGWMIAATLAWLAVAKKIISGKIPVFLSGLLFVVFTTLPWFEGHIPNGELFVMGFILVGAALMSTTNFFKQAVLSSMETAHQNLRLSRKDLFVFLMTGVLAGLAILTKVPALFDLVGLGAVFWFYLVNRFQVEKKSLDALLKSLPNIVLLGLSLLVGALLPIMLSVVYFVSRGSGEAYLDFGLLYNFRYAGSWGLPFTHPLLVWLFSLPGKTIIMAGVILLLSLGKKLISPKLQFVAAWTILALFASLLSNRPYPHYFLQIFPPLTLLIGLSLEPLAASSKKRVLAASYQPLTALTTVLITCLFIAILALLNVGVYQTGSYYQHFWQYATGQLSQSEYFQTFDRLMNDNYQAATIITATAEKKLFIWGTNPALYALTKTAPTGRFTVSFHIKDFNAYDETLRDLEAIAPRFVVVMNNEHQELPGLQDFLAQNYLVRQEFDHFILWQRIPGELPSLIGASDDPKVQ